MFDESSSPAFFKTNKDEIGSCYAIHDFNLVPAEFRPEIALQADSVKDTDWDEANMEIALIAIPTPAPLPYGKEMKSAILDDGFIEEMKGISNKHGFWAQRMSDVIDQFEVDNHTETVLKRMTSSVPVSTSRDLTRAMTKGLRGMTFTLSSFVDASLLGKDSFEAHQEKIKEFYHRNPTPARVEDNNDDEDTDEVHIPVHSTAMNQPPLVVPAAFTNTNPPPEF
jgi:hypothetical protein